jgi:hypothetical protein
LDPMMLKLRMVLSALTLCAALCFATSVASAATIIKLNLGSVGPDVQMNAGGTLSTMNDGAAGTSGDQNTDIEYTAFLDASHPDITTTNASFSLNGLQSVGPANVFGSLVIQNFAGGTFNLYDPANTLLLQGPLTSSALTGVIGPPGTGALFTTTLGAVTGGTLASSILPGSVSISMNLSNVNGGAGFGVVGAGPVLAPFLADASVNIAGEVPEPTTILLVLAGAAVAVAARRNRG